MSKAFIRIVLFLLSITSVFGQEGNYPITHFTSPNELTEIFPHQMIQDRHGMIFIAYNRGVIRFDGKNWETINAPGSIFTLAYYGGKIYTGGPDGFGILERGSHQTWEYVSLHQADTTARITEMVVHDGRLIGLSEHSMSVLDLRNKKYSKLEVPADVLLESIFIFRDELFIKNNQTIPFRLNENKLSIENNQSSLLSGIEFLSPSRDKNIYLAASASGDLLIYRNGFSKIDWNADDPEDLAYIRESEITGATWLSDTLVALSSLKGGVIFIQPFRGKIKKIINARSGLPDNEVYEILSDDNSALWVAHEKGLSRISPYLPYRTFDQFPGLKGNILSIKRHQREMYVGTTEGLYRLKRIENVKNIPVAVSADSRENDKNGFWKSIWPFRKKQSAVARHFRRELQSVEYVFEKIDGLESKVFSLALYNNQLVAAGLDGLYIIDSGKSRQLTSIPVRQAHYSPGRNLLYIISYDGEVYTIVPKSGRQPERILRNQDEPVTYLFEDGSGNMYFCGIHTMYKISARDIRSAWEIASIRNPFYEETFGYVEGDTIYFLHKNTGNSAGNIVAMRESKQIALADRLISDVIPGENGTIWVLTDRIWRKLGAGKQVSMPDLSIFNNASFIADDPGRYGMWIITGARNLFFLENETVAGWVPPYSAFLYEVSAGGELIDPATEIILDQESGNVSFRYSQAEYSHLVDMEYQYQLDGMDETWSDWSRAHDEISFSYLPAGKYTLNFRSRNSLGQVETLPPVHFKVLAPYWKRPWFYLVEFAFIGLMLLISVRMKAMGYKYALMSRLLAVLTLIIIIELIQILAESKLETETSPVVDFVIQVVIAIIILPVEEILRKYIFKENHVKVSDFLALRNASRRKRRKMAIKTASEAETVEEL